MTVAVTGADGFIGGVLCTMLEARGHAVARLVRTPAGAGRDRRVVRDLAGDEPLVDALQGVTAVVHLAARAHMLQESAADPRAAFYRVNVGGTVRLARAAQDAGAHRFVFVSSIGVNGGSTQGTPFTESDVPAPIESYAESKLAAERELRTLERQGGVELVIVRPPMVYGPGAKGNLLRLLSWVHAGMPLPLASIGNRRSLIGVENLCDLLGLCVEREDAAGEIFLAAEPDIHSTPGLVRAIAHAMGRRGRLVHCPPALLALAARLLGRGAAYEKLVGSLQVSAAKARRVLGWCPRVTFEDGIGRMVAAYLDSRHALA